MKFWGHGMSLLSGSVAASAQRFVLSSCCVHVEWNVCAVCTYGYAEMHALKYTLQYYIPQYYTLQYYTLQYYTRGTQRSEPYTRACAHDHPPLHKHNVSCVHCMQKHTLVVYALHRPPGAPCEWRLKEHHLVCTTQDQVSLEFNDRAHA